MKEYHNNLSGQPKYEEFLDWIENLRDSNESIDKLQSELEVYQNEFTEMQP